MDSDAFSIVTNVNDAGDGSFRQAILDNNSETMPGTVTFDPLSKMGVRLSYSVQLISLTR